ncbi:unnamed protein product [Absidia cylindrospora]
MITQNSVSQCVSSNAIGYFRLWFEFLDKNLDPAIGDFFDAPASARSTFIKNLSLPMKQILRTDLSPDELMAFNNMLKQSRSLIDDLSSVLMSDLNIRTTGSEVNLEQIIPKSAQVHTLDKQLTVAPPSMDLIEGTRLTENIRQSIFREPSIDITDISLFWSVILNNNHFWYSFTDHTNPIFININYSWRLHHISIIVFFIFLDITKQCRRHKYRNNTNTTWNIVDNEAIR